MNAIERCKAKLEALKEANGKIADHSARMAHLIDAHIAELDHEIELASKSVGSVLKDYRKKLEKARKIFLPDEVDA